MNRRAFLWLLAVTTAAGVLKQINVASADRDVASAIDAFTVQTLRKQQVRLDQAHKRGDLKTYGSLLTADFVFTDYRGRVQRRAAFLSDLRDSKRRGLVMEPHPWFVDMGFKDLPQTVHFTPWEIQQMIVKDGRGIVIGSASLQFDEPKRDKEHAIAVIHTEEFVHTDELVWRRTRQGWKLTSITSTPQALRDGKPMKEIMDQLTRKWPDGI